MARDQVVEGDAQAIDVAGWPELGGQAGGLLGAHVADRADLRADPRRRQIASRPGPERPFLDRAGRLAAPRPVERFGQAPVDDQRLAERPEHDVDRLDVAVQNFPVVGVGDRVAGVDESSDQGVEVRTLARQGLLSVAHGLVQAADGGLQGLAPDEPHDVVGPAVRTFAHPVDRDDPGVLEPAGDFGLTFEAGPVLEVVGPSVLDLLDGDVPMDFPVVSQADDAQAPLGVFLADLVARAQPVRSLGPRVGRAFGEPGQDDPKLRVGDLARVEPKPDRVAQGQQALPGDPSVLLQVLRGEGGDHRGVRLVEAAPLDEDLEERSARHACPGVEGSDQGFRGDQPVGQREQAHEQTSLGLVPVALGQRDGRLAVNPDLVGIGDLRRGRSRLSRLVVQMIQVHRSAPSRPLCPREIITSLVILARRRG